LILFDKKIGKGIKIRLNLLLLYSTISFDTRARSVISCFSEKHKQLTERKIMAHVQTCRFCNRTSTNCDHDECAKSFFKGLNSQVMHWHIVHPGRPLPPKIAKKFTSEEYKWYLEYAEREEQARAVQRRCTDATKILQMELQQLGKELVQESYPGLQISVVCKVTPVMTC
jgi:hypothetical protein